MVVMIFVIILSVIFLSMLMILLSTLKMIGLLIFGDNLSWPLILNVTIRIL